MPKTEIADTQRLMTCLWVCIAAHALGLVSIALILQPGIDLAIPGLERARFIAEHPWLWRIGWLPWQLSALSNIALSFAFLFWTRHRSRAAQVLALLALLATLAGAIPEQTGELQLETSFVTLARDCLRDGVGAPLDAEHRRLMHLLAFHGNNGYTLMSLLWLAATCVIAPASPLRRLLMTVMVPMTALFVAMSVMTWWQTHLSGPDIAREPLALILVNAAAFPLLLLAFALFGAVWGEAHAARAPATDEALHRMVWPETLPGRPLAHLGNATGLRDLIRAGEAFLPPPVLRSDITDVVYLNWLVPTARARRLLPPALEPDDLDGRTALSILTYRHGGFGPGLLGPLRRLLCPSPAQSNWRFNLAPERPGASQDAIYFFKTSIDSTPFAVASRLLADGLPSHRPAALYHDRWQSELRTELQPGGGSAPDLQSCVRITDAHALPASFARRFDTPEAALRYLVEQNRGLNHLPRLGALVSSNIDIPIPIASIEPAEVVSLSSTWLADLIDGCECFAFVVPAVPFAACGEEVRPLEVEL